MFLEFLVGRCFREFAELAETTSDGGKLVEFRDVRVEAAESCEDFAAIRDHALYFFLLRAYVTRVGDLTTEFLGNLRFEIMKFRRFI
jgi:hypothetical protein